MIVRISRLVGAALALSAAFVVWVGGAIGDLLSLGEDSEGTDPAATMTEPEEFRATRPQINALIREVVGGRAQPTVGCVRGYCSISYTTQGIGLLFAGEETIDQTRPLFAAMFSAPDFEETVLTVRGPVPDPKRVQRTGRLFSLRCDRADDERIAWEAADVEQLRRVCEFKPFAAGLER